MRKEQIKGEDMTLDEALEIINDTGRDFLASIELPPSQREEINEALEIIRAYLNDEEVK